MSAGKIEGKAWDTRLIKRLAVYARPHRRKFLQAFLVLLALFAATLTTPWLMRSAIDGPMTQANKAQGLPGYDSAPYIGELGWWALAYLVTILITAGLRFLEVSQLARAGQAVIHDLRTKLFNHIQRLDLAWFDGRPSGSLVTRVSSDIENLNELFTSGLIVLLFDLLKIVVLLAVLFYLSTSLTWIVLLLTPLLILVSVIFRGGARSAHRLVREHLSEMNGYLQEVLSGIRVVQVFRSEKQVGNQFNAHLSTYLKANFRTIFLFALFYPILSFITVGIQGSVLWRGGGTIHLELLSFGQFIQYWLCLQLLLAPIRELGERYNVLQSAFASAERIFLVMDTQPGLRLPQNPRTLGDAAGGFRGHIRFENVSFSYATGPKVLDDVSFEIPAGHTVALVGATGSGKSTLINLLLRYYEPSTGRITIDGIPLSELDMEAYRAELGLVLQEDFMFNGSIEDNLTLGRARVTQASLAQALETSAAISVVERMPLGLASPVAERGATFSTGERELLAIARALAGSPSMIILDEATSSVDSVTEARIENGVHTLLDGRSALVVAHRLSTVRRANRILVMHRGKLHEAGSHDELLEQDGIYARLYAMQFHGTHEDDSPEA